MLELLQFAIDHVLTSRGAWAAEVSLLIILMSLTLLLFATVVYSQPIQRLWRDIKRLISAAGRQAESAAKSPYDKEIHESTLFSWVTIVSFYTLSLFTFLYFVLFIVLAMGVFGSGAAYWSRPLALLVGIVFLFVARLLKVQGDRILHRWKCR